MPDKGLRVFQATVARLSAAYPEAYLVEGPQTDKVVALTFDDGPDPVMTPRLLAALKEAEAVATFFLIGERMAAHPAWVEKIRAAGHAVAGHGYEHVDHRKLSVTAAHTEQFVRAEDLVAKHAGGPAGYFRPPYGALTDEQVKAFAERGVLMVLWSVDSLDWSKKYARTAAIRKRVLDQVHPGAVVLLHSGRHRGATADALPGILAALKRDGYRFVTIEQMFGFERPAKSAPR
jgi:peptidoglycan/xylan/chitin deacetylase (PgdA/CDA1 family)